ncbi:DUF1501 domain-containing protein [Tuwongella immobilis]|uniref:Sulfatase n=1 Tax=Tuwongella immobilis TaxID=692036 RepID=A0A6C2YMU7_9BACT|nr:DUF1501 domain-containing protein [Tuwongella immobilis]VIP02930.1 secreted protein containing duf1501 : Uncharacterized protein OS=Singulisphaera acidiphila (strain ATCC BAA-1392 / DSM 18658 / VKM B-2454 / MOB10) GN=Sinac_3955 PE=4 SV=1: DUF1501 [Tuwongella immobilis]VTS02878.1 secreted protein containing duf1501 : Uncharacterized protein OS=Singulisphaera acidiphila (strain ATCC BAA-1392 / DSM 18658 / VKM B-2454 / MOB10) GN=Sinac_3955 PE=4 SV=1: DUF1501 [Tuwongella immobilis]
MDMQASQTRRNWLKSTSAGFGMVALAGLLGHNQPGFAAPAGSPKPLAPKAPHFPAKAKKIIFVFMQGAISQVDTFEYKPELQKNDGKGGPGGGKLTASKFKFQQYGQTGSWFSELLPNLARHADDLCWLRGLHTDTPAHPQAVVQLHTGSANAALTRPSMGAWLLYGLGTENQDLPGYITINPPPNFGGAVNFGSAFLPAHYQGSRINDQGYFPNLESAVSSQLQRKQLDLIQSLNRDLAGKASAPDQVEGIIESYELAFKMQDKVPDLLDISKEPRKVLDAYGVKNGPAGSFARQCVMARRLCEAGVRFVEICQPGWDHHNNLHKGLIDRCQSIDQPVAALLTDLKQRGMLEDTLVLFGSEFGRQPTAQGVDGRDHNITGYPMFLMGAGVKPGFTYGGTDEFGIKATEGRMHTNDLHATLLALMGLDHERLTYRYAGRDFRLTDVAGSVVSEIMA